MPRPVYGAVKLVGVVVEAAAALGAAGIPDGFLAKASRLATLRFAPEVAGSVTSIGANFCADCRDLRWLDLRHFGNVATVGPGFLSRCAGLRKGRLMLPPEGTAVFVAATAALDSLAPAKRDGAPASPRGAARGPIARCGAALANGRACKRALRGGACQLHGPRPVDAVAATGDAATDDAAPPESSGSSATVTAASSDVDVDCV